MKQYPSTLALAIIVSWFLVFSFIKSCEGKVKSLCCLWLNEFMRDVTNLPVSSLLYTLLGTIYNDSFSQVGWSIEHQLNSISIILL